MVEFILRKLIFIVFIISQFRTSRMASVCYGAPFYGPSRLMESAQICLQLDRHGEANPSVHSSYFLQASCQACCLHLQPQLIWQMFCAFITRLKLLRESIAFITSYYCISRPNREPKTEHRYGRWQVSMWYVYILKKLLSGSSIHVGLRSNPRGYSWCFLQLYIFQHHLDIVNNYIMWLARWISRYGQMPPKLMPGVLSLGHTWKEERIDF